MNIQLGVQALVPVFFLIFSVFFENKLNNYLTLHPLINVLYLYFCKIFYNIRV
jgi:hypothetical protein